jgi:hypothetical protein
VDESWPLSELWSLVFPRRLTNVVAVLTVTSAPYALLYGWKSIFGALLISPE